MYHFLVLPRPSVKHMLLLFRKLEIATILKGISPRCKKRGATPPPLVLLWPASKAATDALPRERATPPSRQRGGGKLSYRSLGLGYSVFSSLPFPLFFMSTFFPLFERAEPLIKIWYFSNNKELKSTNWWEVEVYLRCYFRRISPPILRIYFKISLCELKGIER